MAEAALVITLKVPMTLRFWMNWNGARSWGEPSRLMTRPTQPVPAQLTAMRRLPPSAAWSTAFWQSSGSVTSPPTKLALAPISATTSLPRSSLRSKTVTRTPSAASLRAVASPRPEAPPVMIAELPLISMPAGYGRQAATGAKPAGRSVAGYLAGRGLGGQQVDHVVHPVPRVPLDPLEGDRPVRVEGQRRAAPATGPGWPPAFPGCCASPAASTRPTTSGGSSSRRRSSR